MGFLYIHVWWSAAINIPKHTLYTLRTSPTPLLHVDVNLWEALMSLWEYMPQLLSLDLSQDLITLHLFFLPQLESLEKLKLSLQCKY